MAYCKAYQDNRLRDQHPHGSAQVLFDEFAEVNFDFLLFGMDAPVLRAPPQLRRFVHQNHRRVCFFEEYETQRQASEAHDGCDVLRPAPAEVGHVDEATNEWCQERTCKNCHGENSDGQTSLPVVEHVRKDSTDASKWTSSKEAAEESAYEYRLAILGHRYCQIEDAESEGTDDDGPFPTVQL